MANLRKRNELNPTDTHSAESLTYNEAAGARKVAEVGRSLLPIPKPSASPPFTTNVTTVTALQNMGMNFAIYNNAGAVGSVNFGTAGTLTSLAPGVCDANGSVGIACPPNAWTYVSSGENNFIIASAATLLVYIIEDQSFITLTTSKGL